MGFDTSAAQAAWHPLLEIGGVVLVAGGSTSTLRYADVDLALSDGTLYEGRIASFSPLRQDLGRLLEPQFILPEMSVELRNEDDAISDLLALNANFVGLTCTLKMGQGTTSTDYESRFVGEVRYPDGVTESEETVTFVFTDALEADNAIMPANKIFPADYPRAETRSKFLPIPEVLGDFRSTAGGGETVPGYCVDSAANEVGTDYVALWTLRAAKMENATTFTDSSGNGYHATSGAGVPSFVANHAGSPSSAMEFDGTFDFVNADAVVPAIASDIVGTIAWWCKPSDAVALPYQVLFCAGDTDQSTFLYLAIAERTYPGRLAGFLYAGGVLKWAFLSSASVPIFADGQNAWTHLALVQDGAGLTLYVNGAAREIVTTGSTDLTAWFADCTGLDNARIGCANYNNAGNREFFEGGISDVRIYSTALSADDIAILPRMAGQFTFGQHLESIEAVYINGRAVNYTVDQLTGPSLVSIDEAYDSTTDNVAAHVYGRITSNSGGAPTDYDLPTAWIYDLLTQSWAMNLNSSARVDAAAFTAAHAQYGENDRCRRWVGSDVQVATLLAELAHDGFVELVLGIDGKYKPEFRTTTAVSSLPIYREVDIQRTGNVRAIRIQSDPERTYANQIAYDFRLTPPVWTGGQLAQDREYGAGGVVDDTSEQTLTKRTTRRRIHCRWLYVDAEDRGSRDLLAYANRLEFVSLLLGPRGLTLDKGDLFQLIYRTRYGASDIYGTVFQVRSIAPDYGGMTAEVVAWNVDSISPRWYQEDGTAAWDFSAPKAIAAHGGYYGAFVGDDDQRYA